MIQIGNATLYLGDCAEILPTMNQVDAIVTDPPWNMNYFDDDNKSWEEYALWLDNLNNQYKLITKNIFVFLSSKSIPYVSHIYKGWQPFVTVKNFSQMSKSKNLIPNAFDIGFALIDESYSGNGRNWWLCNTAGMLRERTGHPTPRTLDCMENCLNLINSNLILDPFMGSGTTGVACVSMGKKFIGIEKEQKYFDIACQRIEYAQKQERLFA